MSSESRSEVRAAHRTPARTARAVAAPVPAPRAAAVLVALLLALAAVLVPAGRAAAHNTLLGTDPEDGSTVAAAPAAVTLTFDQPAQALGTEIVVLGPDGSTVSTGEPELVDNTVAQPLAADLPAGDYAVQWRVTSADGHPLSGELTFTATEGAAAAAPATEAPVETIAPGPEVTTPAAQPSPITETLAPEAELAEDEEAGLAAGAIVAIAAAVLAAAAVAVFVVRQRRGSKDARTED
jgi:methionine-rich copper-binding protein CopC